MLEKDRLQRALVHAGVVLSSKVRRKISAELMEGGSQQLQVMLRGSGRSVGISPRLKSKHHFT